MARTWVSYIVLAIGLMLLVASDKQSVAENKEESHVISFADSKDIQVFVNKMGSADQQVDIMINGKKHSFTIPELVNGQVENITTDDGTNVLLKTIKGNQVVFIGDEEVKLPELHRNTEVGREGLSSIITRVHAVSDFTKDAVIIRSTGLSEDATKAMVDAVKGVLVSYGIEKEVLFREAPKFELLSNQNVQRHGSSRQWKSDADGNLEIKVESNVADKDIEKIILLQKHIEVKDEKK